MAFRSEKRSTNEYLRYVQQLCMRKPSLTYLSKFLSDPYTTSYPCRMVALSFFEGRCDPSARELNYEELYSMLVEGYTRRQGSEAVNSDTLSGAGMLPESEFLQGRILLVEDVNKSVLELLGLHLDIDPLFFAGHMHIPWSGASETQVPEQCVLPSQAKKHSFMNIHYHRIVRFNRLDVPATRFLRCMNIERKMVISSLSKNEDLGLVQHCASIHMFKKKPHWLGLVLVDRDLDGEFLYSIGNLNGLHRIKIESQLFLGGYEDFLESPSITRKDEKDISAPRRRGLSGDLLFYWSTKQPQSFRASEPCLSSIAYYPLKVVGGEWMKYAAIMYRAVKQFEYSTAPENAPSELDRLNTDMAALQQWRRRYMASERKVKAVLRMLEIGEAIDTSCADMISLKQDYRHVLDTLQSFGRSLENMLPVVTTLVQVIDTRRSVEETANVSRLTVMALVFVPLAYIASLFSMNEGLGPGGPLFWVYFVVAVPVTVVVIIIAKPRTPLLFTLSASRYLQWHFRRITHMRTVSGGSRSRAAV